MADLNYEARVFDASSTLTRIIPLCCRTDTDALMQLVRMGVGDFQKIAIWRERECIYGGRDVKLAALHARGSLFGEDSLQPFLRQIGRGQ